MALIDPDGLFQGERLAACSDLAQLYWPRLFLAANTCARIELSYKSIISHVFGNFQKPPEISTLWRVFEEFSENFLVVLYDADGVWWCQFITSEKYLVKYKKIRDEKTPAPPPFLMEKHRLGYLEWKKRNSYKNQSFHKISESFQWQGVGVGVGIGIGIGVGIGEARQGEVLPAKTLFEAPESLPLPPPINQLPDPYIDAPTIAREIKTRCRITSDQAWVAIEGQVRHELGPNAQIGALPDEADRIIAGMSGAWQKYNSIPASHLKYKWGAQTFFGEDHWRKDPTDWPWLPGKEPPTKVKYANGAGR